MSSFLAAKCRHKLEETILGTDAAPMIV